MKKILLYILIIPALAVGCSSDPDETKPLEGNLKVDKPSLEFPATGGSQVLEVTAENLAAWEAYANISWIKLGEPDLANGTIVVTVGPTEEINDLEGRIVIHSELEDVVNVYVRQAGQGKVHDRNWLTRMNLNGPVESIECFFSPYYIWEADSGYLYDVELNRQGNPTSFMFATLEDRGENNVLIFRINQAQVTYDGNDRIKTVTVTTDVTLGDGNPYEYTVTFTYGNHGKYIETGHLFKYLKDDFYFDINHRMLLPAMMKDLVRIDVWNTGIVPRDFTVEFRFEGDTASANWTRVIENEYRESVLLNYTFSNGYTNVNYDGYFLNLLVPYKYNYNVDPQSGNIQDETFYFMEGMTLGEKRYHDNFLNSLSYFSDALWTTLDMTFEYDEFWNVTRIDEHYYAMTAEFEYDDFDQYGNWTTIEQQYTLYEPTFTIPPFRNITYYE